MEARKVTLKTLLVASTLLCSVGCYKKVEKVQTYERPEDRKVVIEHRPETRTIERTTVVEH